MRTSFTKLYVHLVWTTWDRLLLISPTIEARLYAAMVAKCIELNCEALEIGGVEDHVHLLVRFTSKITIADLVKEIKGSSSHLVTHEITPGEFFKWQGAYRAFTVGPGEVKRVRRYIRHQKAHHRDETQVLEWELPAAISESDNTE
jgi:REP element-mobilizing transposase RayT